jgi:mono/diheme cytochrome c family protein
MLRSAKFLYRKLGLLAVFLTAAPPAHPQGATFSSIERGRYLASAGDCQSCHTNEGGAPYAGGRPIPTPFGTIYSTNITPDSATGIGKWSDEDFYKAMHAGIRRDGKHLYPAFPYPWFTSATADDVRAIKAFLDTLTPVRQANKPADLPWPLSAREVMSGWNTLYFHEGTFKADTKKSDVWNRGAYLVQGLGHCGACHTPTNALGAPKTDAMLKGGDFGEHWYAPNLGGDLKRGLGAWSTADIVEYLKTGSNAKSASGGPMAEVVKNSTQYLSDADLNAIAVYLKDLPADKPGADSASKTVDSQRMAHGEAIYVDNCTGCHMENGAGIAKIFPSLKASSGVQAEMPDTVIHIVLAGARTPATSGKPTSFAMPAFDRKLNDDEVADVVNYIRNAWGNHGSPTSADAVSKIRKAVTQGVE